MFKSQFDPKGVDTATLKTVKKAFQAELAKAELEGLSTTETSRTIGAINKELRTRTERRWNRAQGGHKVSRVG